MTRPPFDLVEAEEELSGGYNLEYSSIDFAWFYLAEYAALVTNSAIIVTLWFGGPDGPRIAGHSIGPFWFVIKVLIILLHLRVDPGHPAPAALRPADGSGLEAADPGRPGHAHDRGRPPDQLRRGGWSPSGPAWCSACVFCRAIDVGQGATEVEAAREPSAWAEEGMP